MKPKFYFPIFLILTSISFSEPVKEDSTKIEDEWLAFDKVQHFTYSLLLTLSTQYVLVNNMNMDEENSLLISVFSSLSTGIMKERSDMKKPKGYFSKKTWSLIVWVFFWLLLLLKIIFPVDLFWVGCRNLIKYY